MNITADPVHILTPQFVDLGLSAIDALDKGIFISTPPIRIQIPVDGVHRSATNLILGESTVVRLSEAKSDYD